MSANLHTPTTGDVAVDRVVRGRDTVFQDDIVRSGTARKLLAGLRILIGWTFMWPFLDKLFGLGYGTESAGAWVEGGAPAQGYMLNATSGPFKEVFIWMAETFGGLADFLFMFGLFGIGLAMLAGAGLKIAAWGGTLLMAFMYLAALPIGQANMGFTNPITDSHWIEAIVLLVVAYTLSGDTWGLGRWWGKKVGNGWLR
ncbi:DoxX family protein [Ornithinimicrobium faecis]|uniref:DoxX family protein n=1 Tax=Ornithinimicrobium faecis TaxID=2934158 RepID=A0ABY4YPY3_9MICO|nr:MULTISPECIES: DoxX family protein [unclassified Ornithinimicrobium]USQ78811.1 DoxX family protein [Ornithinimicrobium sp. HY1793]